MDPRISPQKRQHPRLTLTMRKSTDAQHLRRATSFAPRCDDFGNDSDADFGRTRGADGKPYGAMDLCELGLEKAGRAHPFEAPGVGNSGAERSDIKAFRAQGRAER